MVLTGMIAWSALLSPTTLAFGKTAPLLIFVVLEFSKQEKMLLVLSIIAASLLEAGDRGETEAKKGSKGIHRDQPTLGMGFCCFL